MSMKGIPAKLRTITDAFLVSQGIDVKVEPISIMDDDFQKDVEKHSRNKTKAAAIEHAIRHHLEVELDDDPQLQASFAEALQKIFEEFANNWKKIYEELEKLRQRIINAGKEPTYGLHRKNQMPIFRMLDGELFIKEDEKGEADGVKEKGPPGGIHPESRISLLVSLTQNLYLDIERELKLVGFWESIPARNKLVADMQKTLLLPMFSIIPGIAAKRKKIISRLMEIAEKNQDTILHASWT